MLPIIYLIVMVNSIDRGIHPHHGCPGGKAEGVWDEPVIVVLCGFHSEPKQIQFGGAPVGNR